MKELKSVAAELKRLERQREILIDQLKLEKMPEIVALRKQLAAAQKAYDKKVDREVAQNDWPSYGPGKMLFTERAQVIQAIKAEEAVDEFKNAIRRRKGEKPADIPALKRRLELLDTALVNFRKAVEISGVVAKERSEIRRLQQEEQKTFDKLIAAKGQGNPQMLNRRAELTSTQKDLLTLAASIKRAEGAMKYSPEDELMFAESDLMAAEAARKKWIAKLEIDKSGSVAPFVQRVNQTQKALGDHKARTQKRLEADSEYQRLKRERDTIEKLAKQRPLSTPRPGVLKLGPSYTAEERRRIISIRNEMLKREVALSEPGTLISLEREFVTAQRDLEMARDRELLKGEVRAVETMNRVNKARTRRTEALKRVAAQTPTPVAKRPPPVATVRRG